MAVLTAPAEVMLARIAARDTNPYGKVPRERALILEHLAQVQPRLLATATATAVIDASVPLAQVADQLEALA